MWLLRYPAMLFERILTTVRLFFVKPELNGQGQPLSVMATVDNLWDMFIVFFLGAILLLGLTAAFSFFFMAVSSSPPNPYTAANGYHQQ